MKERTHAIFDAAMRRFIATGRPVTSEQLFKEYDFGIRPAMIRWELNALSLADYFYQTHPSGGRLPTDKAYRAFVRNLLKEEGVRPLKTAEVRILCEGAAGGEWEELVSGLARQLRTFSFGYEPTRDRVFESGLQNLINCLDGEARGLLLEVAGDIEDLPRRVSVSEAWWQKEREWPQVFVGSSPFTRSRQVAVVAERLSSGRRDFFLLTLGPKRMDYERSLGIFRSLREFVEL